MRAVAVALLALTVLTSCENSDGSDEGVVVFQLAAEAEEAAVYRTLVAAFQRQNPDVEVRMDAIASKADHIQKLNTLFAGGGPPDLFLLNYREFSQYVSRGALEPIGPLLPEVALEDYFAEPLEAFTYQDSLQCFPQNISSLVVYYNEALFREAGLDRPDDDWTIHDFRAAALALSSLDGVDGAGIEPSIIRLAPFAWSNGGEIVDDPTLPSRFTLDDPATKEMLQWMVDLVREDGVVPTEEEVSAQDLETRFATGKLGMLLSSRRETPVFRESTQLEWDVAPLPRSDTPASILHSDAYCLARGGGDPAAALEFVRFAVGEEGQTITAIGGRTVPSLRSVADSGAFLNPVQPPLHAEVFLDAIDGMRRTPVIPTWPEIEDTAEEILTRAFYEDGYSVEKAIEELDRQTRSLFEEGSR